MFTSGVSVSSIVGTNELAGSSWPLFGSLTALPALVSLISLISLVSLVFSCFLSFSLVSSRFSRYSSPLDLPSASANTPAGQCRCDLTGQKRWPVWYAWKEEWNCFRTPSEKQPQPGMSEVQVQHSTTAQPVRRHWIRNTSIKPAIPTVARGSAWRAR
jgi:hypothetical protein